MSDTVNSNHSGNANSERRQPASVRTPQWRLVALAAGVARTWRSKGVKRWLTTGLVIVLPLLGLFALAGFRSAPSVKDLATANLDTALVMTAPFRIVLDEHGEVCSRRNEVVINQVLYRTTILNIVPEGTFVNKGDVVCELDSSELREMAEERKIHLTRYVAKLRDAEETVAIQEILNDRMVAAAQHDVEFADLDLRSFEDGGFPQKLQENASRSTLAEQALSRAYEMDAFTNRMAQKGYRTAKDVASSRLKLMESRNALEIAEGKERLYADYTAKRTRLQLEGEMRDSQSDLKRTLLKADRAMTVANISLLTRQRVEMLYRDYCERLQGYIAACTMRAPCDGKIVYASTGQRYWYRPVIREGARVYYRQPIFKIPDTSEMRVEIRIHESRIHQVHVGQPAVVRVSAYEDDTFNAVIDSISQLPRVTSHYFPDRREYDVTLRITDGPEKMALLKPGMSAKTEVLVQERPSVLQVPVESIVSIGQNHLSFVATDKGLEPRRVLIGATNDNVVEIAGGLSEGEEVVLHPSKELLASYKTLDNVD